MLNKSNLLILITLLAPGASGFCQKTTDYEFVGGLRLNDSSLITYKLNFDLLENNKISGYSTTDFYGSQKTKSKIEGQFDRDKKLLSFVETENIASVASASEGDFCFVHVKGAAIKKVKGQMLIDGKFFGTFPNDSACASGTLKLVATDLIRNDEKKSLIISEKQKEKAKALLAESDQISLSHNGKLNFNWQSNQVTLEVFDAENVDDDRISVYVNDKPVLEDFSTGQEKKTIMFPFEGEECRLKILALSEGKTPPNTVSINLVDVHSSTTLVTNLFKGETTYIVLKKTKTSK